jgi:hypothetical protein
LREHLGRGLKRIAASAVEAPTDFRKARRAASLGNIARITAEATTPS